MAPKPYILWCLLFFSALPAFATPEYERPPLDIEFTDPRIRMVAGLRPYRKGGIRLERERLGQADVIHNYGHGGAGITLSWGTVEEAIALAGDSLDSAARIVVVGAGVTGLTTAYELLRLGYRPTLYAADFVPDIVSNVAGGLFHPASVDLHGDPNPERVKRIVKRSFLRYRALEGFPVREMPYLRKGDPESPSDAPFGLDALVKLGLLPPIVGHTRLPIEGVVAAGKEYRSFLIDTPRYMKQLFGEVKRQMPVIQKRFASVEDLLKTAGPEAVVFNCTGLGSKKLFKDDNLIPIKGQLVLVKRDSSFPASDGDFMASFNGYYFPRQDELVLGGTYEMNVWDPTPDPAAGKDILSRHKQFFGFTKP